MKFFYDNNDNDSKSCICIYVIGKVGFRTMYVNISATHLLTECTYLKNIINEKICDQDVLNHVLIHQNDNSSTSEVVAQYVRSELKLKQCG